MTSQTLEVPMLTPADLHPLLSTVESHDFLVTVLVVIAGFFVGIELLLNRASARFRARDRAGRQPPNPLP